MLLSPFVLATGRQQGQISWLVRPALHDLTGFYRGALGSRWSLMLFAMVVLVAAAGVATRRLSSALPESVLALGWAGLPPTALWAFSQVHPLYQERYVLFALPGVALVVARAVYALARPAVDRGRSRATWLGLAAVTAVAALGAPEQVVLRGPVGHGEDVAQVARLLASEGRPGDAVFFLPESLRVVALLDASSTRRIDDAALDVSPAARRAGPGVSGQTKPAEQIIVSLRQARRVWVVHVGDYYDRTPGSADLAKLAALAADFRLLRAIAVNHVSVDLYMRSANVP